MFRLIDIGIQHSDISRYIKMPIVASDLIRSTGTKMLFTDPKCYKDITIYHKASFKWKCYDAYLSCCLPRIWNEI